MPRNNSNHRRQCSHSPVPIFGRLILAWSSCIGQINDCLRRKCDIVDSAVSWKAVIRPQRKTDIRESLHGLRMKRPTESFTQMPMTHEISASKNSIPPKSKKLKESISLNPCKSGICVPGHKPLWNLIWKNEWELRT